MIKAKTMKSIVKISILFAGILVAILCVSTTLSLKTIDYQKEQLGHIIEDPDPFISKTLPHKVFKMKRGGN